MAILEKKKRWNLQIGRTKETKIEKAQKSGKSCHNMFVKLRSHDYLAIKGVPIGKTIYKKDKFYYKLHGFYLKKSTNFYLFVL